MGLGLLRGAALLPGAVSSRREIEDLALALGRDAAAAVSRTPARAARSPLPAPSRSQGRSAPRGAHGGAGLGRSLPA